MSQGLWAASTHWERQGNGFSPGTSRRNTVLPTPGISPREPGLDFRTATLEDNKFVLFAAAMSVVIY